MKWMENSDSKDKSISLRSCENDGQISCSLAGHKANLQGDPAVATMQRCEKRKSRERCAWAKRPIAAKVTLRKQRVISSSGTWFGKRRGPILSLRVTNRHALARIQNADAHSSDTGCAS